MSEISALLLVWHFCAVGFATDNVRAVARNVLEQIANKPETVLHWNDEARRSMEKTQLSSSQKTEASKKDNNTKPSFTRLTRSRINLSKETYQVSDASTCA